MSISDKSWFKHQHEYAADHISSALVLTMSTHKVKFTVLARSDENRVRMMNRLLFPQIKQNYVISLNDNDVLLGRGSRNLENQGNIKFRNLIKKRKVEYSNAVRRIRKDDIAREVIASIESMNGRFLKKVESRAELLRFHGYPGVNVQDVWVKADEETILLKVKQAFRNCEIYDEPDSDDSNPADATERTTSSPPAQAESAQAGREQPAAISQQTSFSWSQARTNTLPQTKEYDQREDLKCDEIPRSRVSKVEAGLQGHSRGFTKNIQPNTKMPFQNLGALDKKIDRTDNAFETKAYPRRRSISGMGENPFLAQASQTVVAPFDRVLNQDRYNQMETILSDGSRRQQALFRHSDDVGRHLQRRTSLLSASSGGCQDQQQISQPKGNLPPGQIPFDSNLNPTKLSPYIRSQGVDNSMGRIENARLEMLRDFQDRKRRRSVGYDQHGGVSMQELVAANLEQVTDPRLAAELRMLQSETQGRGQSNVTENYELQKARLLEMDPFSPNPLVPPSPALKAAGGGLLKEQNETTAPEGEATHEGMSRPITDPGATRRLPQDQQFELTQIEAIIIDVLSSYGLPVWTFDEKLGFYAHEFSSEGKKKPSSASKFQCALTWFDLATFVSKKYSDCQAELENYSRKASGTSENDLTPIGRAKQSVTNFVKDPKDFAKKCIMLLEKLRRLSLSSTEFRDCAELGTAVPLWLETEFSRWAISLGVADDNGRPVPFSSADFLSQFQEYKSHDTMIITTALTPRSCNRIFDQIAMLTRLRSVCRKKEIDKMVAEALVNANITGDFWKDLPNLGDGPIYYERVLLERCLEGGLEAVADKESDKMPSFRALGFNPLDIQRRANELTREIHLIDNTGCIDEVIKARLQSDIDILAKGFPEESRKRKATA